jgi:regulation of enolase protein 1 (concanavalin A-like superfamily)
MFELKQVQVWLYMNQIHKERDRWRISHYGFQKSQDHLEIQNTSVWETS